MTALKVLGIFKIKQVNEIETDKVPSYIYNKKHEIVKLDDVKSVKIDQEKFSKSERYNIKTKLENKGEEEQMFERLYNLYSLAGFIMNKTITPNLTKYEKGIKPEDVSIQNGVNFLKETEIEERIEEGSKNIYYNYRIKHKAATATASKFLSKKLMKSLYKFQTSVACFIDCYSSNFTSHEFFAQSNSSSRCYCDDCRAGWFTPYVETTCQMSHDENAIDEFGDISINDFFTEVEIMGTDSDLSIYEYLYEKLDKEDASNFITKISFMLDVIKYMRLDLEDGYRFYLPLDKPNLASQYLDFLKIFLVQFQYFYSKSAVINRNTILKISVSKSNSIILETSEKEEKKEEKEDDKDIEIITLD